MDAEKKKAPERLVREAFSPALRKLREETVAVDLVVVGGGLAGTCAAIAAAREGMQVALVQDRPVLGGNASSEVRLWILGATSHMGNNNRWSREGGVVGEFLEENVYRNPEGNPLIVDTLLLEMVRKETNIRLFLNTSVHEVAKSAADEIEACTGFCSQNSTRYHFRAPFFMDASGDGVAAFLAGASFRMGAERNEEWGEGLAPDESYGSLLGHSLYFYSKDVGRPVEFHAPAFAGKETKEIARHRPIELGQFGCRLWWVEYGGRRDTVHETEEIKWELWKVIYGIWDYIKNSGEYPEAATHTLEWVGTIPGKRESRRFEALHMMTQPDVVQRRSFTDVIAHGGWALDLHPADGVYTSLPGCNQWHSKGVYSLPLRSYLSRDIRNLVLGGRIIGASHVAFGSTRVMATCAVGAQATAQAVAAAHRHRIHLHDLPQSDALTHLQQDLLKAGQYLPGVRWAHPEDLAPSADWNVSSEWALETIPPGEKWIELSESLALLLPAGPGELPEFRFRVRASAPTEVECAIRVSERPDEFTPERTLASAKLSLEGGEQSISWKPDLQMTAEGYIFLTLWRKPGVEVLASDGHFSGLTTVYNGKNKAVGNHGLQDPPEGIGVDRFEFWCPRRRPHPQLPHLICTPPAFTMGLDQLRNGYMRPTATPGCWIADPEDPDPCLSLHWPEEISVRTILMIFDGDFDNAMESVLQGHADRVAPMCVRSFRLTDENGRELAACEDNHRSRVCLTWENPQSLRTLHLHLSHPGKEAPASLFHLSVH